MSQVPSAAHWCDGDPITDVQIIAGIEDRYHRHVVDGRPVATGLVAVGDAWACTNPSIGRGASIGLLHAVTLRDVLRDVGADTPDPLVRRFDAATEAAVTPWYRATLAFDRHRLAEIDAEIQGVPYRTPDPAWAMTRALYAAALRDPIPLRAHASILSMLAPAPEALAAPGVLERVIALGANAPRHPEHAPWHDELVAAVDGTQPPLRTPAATAPADPRLVTLEVTRLFVQDQGTGEPVLLLHGWPDRHTLWNGQVAALPATPGSTRSSTSCGHLGPDRQPRRLPRNPSPESLVASALE